MTELEFLYENKIILIQCNKDEKMINYFQKFFTKTELDKNSVYFSYHEKILSGEDYEKKIEDIMNEEDKQANKMRIIVKLIGNKDINRFVKSKTIICPECGENCFIKIEGYKVTLFNCRNGHEVKDINFDEYEKKQKIDISKIFCENCKEKNKSLTFEKKFYRCLSCKKNLCPICKCKHDKNHIFIDYDIKDYICEEHNDLFIKYCCSCKQNLCLYCKDHDSHECISFERIIPNIDDLKNNITKLRKKLDKFNEKIKMIINKINKVKENMEIYYNIYNDMLNNFLNKNRNYELIQNLNEITANNHNISKDIKIVIFEPIINKFETLMDIYDKMINDNITENYDNGNKYIGGIENGLRNGKGIMLYANGDKYKGYWKNGLFNGKGVYYLSNGDKYEGDYLNDMKEGKGIYYCSNGDRYEGEWKNNKMEGKGIYYYRNGNKYEGEYKKGKREGKGKYYYNNGDIYDGDWKEGKMEGKGIYYYSNGYRYEGDYKHDKREGKGIFYNNNEERQMGDYLDDKCVGKHVMLNNKGEISVKDF